MAFSATDNSLAFWGKPVDEVKNPKDGFQAFGKYVTSSFKDPLIKASLSETQEVFTSYAQFAEKGTVSSQKFLDTISKTNDGMQGYLSTVDAGKATYAGYAKYVDEVNAKTKSLSAGLNATKIAAAALNTVLNFAVMFLITKGIQIAVKAWDDHLHALEKNQEKLKDLKSEYESATSEITSLQDELTTIQDRMAEIEAVGTINLVADEEYQKLSSTNDELERSLRIQQERQRLAGIEQDKAATETIEHKINSHYSTGDKVTRYQELELGIDTYRSLLNEVEDIKKEMDNLVVDQKMDTSAYKSLEVQLSSYESYMQHVRENLNELASDLEEEFSSLADTNPLAGIVSGSLDNYNGFLDQITGITSALEEVDEAVTTLESEPITMSSLFADDSAFKKDINEAVSSFSTLHDALEKFNAGELDDSSLVNLIEAFPDLTSKADDMGDAIVATINEINSATVEQIDEQIKNLLNSGEDTSGLERIRDAIKHIADEATSLNSLENQFRRSIEGASTLQSSLNSAISESMSGSGISLDTYDAIKDAYGSAIEMTANGLSLNIQKMEQLQKAESAVIKSKFANERKKLNAQLKENAQALKECNKEIEQGASMDHQKVNLEIEAQGLQEQLDNIKALENQYIGATSAYQKYLDAMHSPNSGDMYDTIYEGIEKTKELYDKGLVGTDDFRAYTELISGQDLVGKSAAEVVDIYESLRGKVKSYFTEGQIGCVNFLEDVKALGNGWAEFNQEGVWEINFGNDADVAEKLGISVEAVQAILKKLRDYGADIDIDYYGATGLDNKINDLRDAQAKLREAKEFLATDEGHNSTLALKNVEDSMAEVEALKASVREFVEMNPELVIDIDSAEGEAAIKSAQGTLAEYKHYVEQLSTLQVGTSAYDEMLGKVELMESKISGLDPAIQVELDLIDDPESLRERVTDGSIEIPVEFVPEQDAMEVVSSQLEELISTVEDGIVVRFESDITDVEDATENIQSSIDDVDGTVEFEADTAVATKDATFFSNMVQGIKDKTVTIAASTAGAISSLNSFLAQIPLRRTINIETKTSSSGIGRVNGTANATGTANTFGDWRAPETTTSLVGELGPETIVRDGKYFTVGNRGAEFTQVKKGDIIFNHRQTEELFKNGQITSRGKAYLEGTANSSGTWKPNPGGSGSTANSSISSNKKSSSSGSSSSKSSNSSSSTEKEFEETIDWIEILFTTFELSIDRLNKKATQLLDRFRDQNKVLDKQIAKTEEYIKVQQQAYDRYMAQANSVGLSGHYKDQVKNGTIDIETIKDEDLRDKISDYQNWYEKARNVKDTIDDLNISLKELASQKLENIVDDYERMVSYANQLISLQSSKISSKQAKGSKVTPKDYESMIAQQKAISKYLTSQSNALEKELNSLMKKGSIKANSDAWYEWREKIAAVNTSLEDTKTAIKELTDNIRDLRWEGFNKGIDAINNLNSELDTYIGLIDDAGTLDDSGQFTNQGLTKLALYSQKLSNAKKEVAEYTVAMNALKKELKNGVITQAQYDEKLAEYQKAQQQAVTATKQAKDSIISLVKDGINKATEAYRKLINTKKEALQQDREYQNYEQQLADKSKEINAVKAQMAALEGNENAKTELKRLNAQLQKLNDEYLKIKQDHEYDMKMQGYDDALTAFEEAQESELELLESNLDAQNEAIAGVLSQVQNNYKDVYTYLGTLADTYNVKLSTDLVNSWKSAKKAAEQYQAAVEKTTSSTKIDTSAVKVKTASNEAKKTTSSSSSSSSSSKTSSSSSSSSSSSNNANIWKGIGKYTGSKSGLNINQSIMDRMKYNGYEGSYATQKILWGNLGNTGTYTGTAAQNTKMLSQLKSKGYAKGARRINKDQLALTQEDGIEVISTKYGMLTPLEAGNRVYRNEQTERLFDFSDNPERFMNGLSLNNTITPNVPSTPLIGDVGGGSSNVSIGNLINVEGSADAATVKDLQKLVKDITYDTNENMFRLMDKEWGRYGHKRKGNR